MLGIRSWAMKRAWDVLEAQVRAALGAFAQTGDAVRLDEAVALGDRAVGHPGFASLDSVEVAMFWGLGGTARIHRVRAGPDHPEGLDEAIEWFGRAYAAATGDDPNRPGYASNLATALTDRYERDGSRVDLDRALRLFAEAVTGLRALGRNAAVALHSEGLAYVDVFEADHDLDALHTAIGRFRAALAGTQDCGVVRGEYAISLGQALRAKAATTADSGTLDEALRVLRGALAAAKGSASEVSALTSLGNALLDQYEFENSSGPLREAASCFEAARGLVDRPSEHAARLDSNLGNTLLACFRETGDEAALDRARTLLEQAVSAFAEGSPAQAACRNNLAACLQELYEHTGQLECLDEAIALHAQSFDPESAAPPDAEKHHNFAVSLLARFRRTSGREDLEQALTLFHAAVDAAPEDSIQRAASLNSLGNTLFARFDSSGDLQDLEAVLAAHQAAVDSVPAGSLDRWMYQGNVGVDLFTRGQRLRRLADIEEAVRLQEEAAAAVSDRSPDFVRLVAGLADSLAERATLRRDEQDVARARATYEQAASLGLQRLPEQAIGSATSWGDWALARQDWDEAVQAYRYGLDAAQELFRQHRLRSHRETWLQAVQTLPHNAAYALAQVGDLAGAAETVEHGRALLLTEALQQRAQVSPAQGAVPAPVPPCPIVYLVASDAGGVALVARPGASAVEHDAVWLPSLARGAVADRVEALAVAYSQRHTDRSRWREALSAEGRWVWDAAVRPLTERFDVAEPVVLVPTGLLGQLPLQAAWAPDGSFPTGRRYAADALSLVFAPNARSLAFRHPHLDLRAAPALTVGDPRPSSLPPLRNAAREAAVSSGPVPGPPPLLGESATLANVRRALPRAHVAHFSCHGRADALEPLQSCLFLADDEPLTVADVLASRLVGDALVVLSACESGVAGSRVPDEVVGLPVALFEAGAATVVGAQWAVGEDATLVVLSGFYARWRGGQSAGEALRQAQIWARDATNGQIAARFPDIPCLLERRSPRGRARCGLRPAASAIPLTGQRSPVWAGWTAPGVNRDGQIGVVEQDRLGDVGAPEQVRAHKRPHYEILSRTLRQSQP